MVKNTHYQIACTKYFEYTHGKQSKNVIGHPNQYFEESRALLDGVVKPGPSAPKQSRMSLNTPKTEEVIPEEMEH